MFPASFDPETLSAARAALAAPTEATRRELINASALIATFSPEDEERENAREFGLFLEDPKLFDACMAAVAVDLLSKILPDARLSSLKKLCIDNGGIWTIPDDPNHKRPVMYEAGVYGVEVAVDQDDLDQLPD